VFEQNRALTSGGGLYFSGELEPNMHNCLIMNNSANRDGGGISANWDVQLGLSNCTIANNTITGGGFASGYGGGVSIAYEAFVKIINSIIWNNNAQYGGAISIGNAFEAADKLRAEASVSYSDIQNGQAGVFVDAPSGSELHWGSGNLSGTTLTSPLFVTGYWGDYYLSQIEAKDPTHTQDADSPCVDSGEGLAIDRDLFRHTTRTDHYRIFGLAIDDGNTDMGYHYLLNADLKGDFNYDGEVNGPDLALFMEYWMEDGCVFPYFCHGRDLTEDGEVDFEDYAIFAANYGATETTPPYPDPMTWKTTPRSAGINIIVMEATTAKDNSGSQVWYHFVRYDSNGITTYFPWRTEPNLTDTGLVYRRQYGYQVQAKDVKGNETDWSVIGYAVPGEDSTAPTPDPMTWLITPTPTSPNSITMTATTATDPCGVQYYFTETLGNPGGSDSGWQDSPIYIDIGLDPNTRYTYQVKARDKSPNNNMTDPSVAISVTTPAQGEEPNGPDTTPPVYTPTTYGLWDTTPYSYYDGGVYYYHYMSAVAATDAESPPVSYSFECISGGGTSSGWFTPANTTVPIVYIAGPFLSFNHSTYQVHIKDAAGNEISSSKWHTFYGLIP
jgi:predicted outer membrane repeat protein